MRYVMMIAGSEAEWDTWTPEQVEAGMQEVYAWFEKWGAAGKIADGGARLDRVATSTTRLRSPRRGRCSPAAPASRSAL